MAPKKSTATRSTSRARTPASKTTRTRATARAARSEGDLGQAEVQRTKDQEDAQGFVGTEVDPTPNENYTVDGVTSGKPTPETDEKLRAKAREAARPA